jgi:hypothetical protein
MDTPTVLKLAIIYLLAYEDGTECSETSAYKIQTPGNYSEEYIQQKTQYMLYASSICTVSSEVRVGGTPKFIFSLGPEMPYIRSV